MHTKILVQVLWLFNFFENADFLEIIFLNCQNLKKLQGMEKSKNC
jgi:hypothetical protein